LPAADPREVAAVCPELFVPDVGAAIDFYTGKLGFTLYRVDPPGDPGPSSEFAIVTLGRAVVMFAHDRLYQAMGGRTDLPRGIAIDIRIMVDDADAMYDRCRQGGVAIVHEIGDRYYGLRDFVMANLNGFRLRFASPLA
jgi:uncharacterized glyoxalase superfamily protein PhnB